MLKVLLSHGYTFAVASVTDWQLYQRCSDQSGVIPQSFFQVVDVTDSAAVDSLLQNASDRVNSFIILFVPYPFSTLSTLIKTFINTAWHHAWRMRRASAG